MAAQLILAELVEGVGELYSRVRPTVQVGGADPAAYLLREPDSEQSAAESTRPAC